MSGPAEGAWTFHSRVTPLTMKQAAVRFAQRAKFQLGWNTPSHNLSSFFSRERHRIFNERGLPAVSWYQTRFAKLSVKRIIPHEALGR